MESSWQSWRRKGKHHQNKVVNCSLRWSNLQQQHENKRCTLLKHLWISAALGRGLGLGVMLGRLRRTFQYFLQPFISRHVLSNFNCYSRVNNFNNLGVHNISSAYAAMKSFFLHLMVITITWSSSAVSLLSWQSMMAATPPRKGSPLQFL